MQTKQQIEGNTIESGVCHVCHSHTNKRCSKCKNVYYCSKECQVKDFPSHKLLCTSLQNNVKLNVFDENILAVEIDRIQSVSNLTQWTDRINLPHTSDYKPFPKNEHFELVIATIYTTPFKTPNIHRDASAISFHFGKIKFVFEEHEQYAFPNQICFLFGNGIIHDPTATKNFAFADNVLVIATAFKPGTTYTELPIYFDVVNKGFRHQLSDKLVPFTKIGVALTNHGNNQTPGYKIVPFLSVFSHLHVTFEITDACYDNLYKYINQPIHAQVLSAHLSEYQKNACINFSMPNLRTVIINLKDAKITFNPYCIVWLIDKNSPLIQNSFDNLGEVDFTQCSKITFQKLMYMFVQNQVPSVSYLSDHQHMIEDLEIIIHICNYWDIKYYGNFFLSIKQIFQG